MSDAKDVSRRDLFKRSVVGAAGLYGTAAHGGTDGVYPKEAAQVVGDELETPRYEAANHLTDDRYYDSLSGQQAYKCFACRVVKA